MKRLLSLFSLLIVLLTSTVYSQNVGIGTTSPTNTLHVLVDPTNPNPNPVRFEGIQRYTTEDSVLVVNPSTGVVKYMPMTDVLANIPPNVLDSLILNSVINNTDTIYNNQSVRDSIIAIALGNADTLFSTQIFRDSVLGVILSNMDTIFTITRDSLLNDSTFINTLRDSIDTDIDSVTFANDTIYIYENGTTVQTYINTSLDTALVDSLILASSDTLYTIISDSLTKDTNWIKQIDSLLSIYGDTIYFNDSTYTLIKDSLLNDTAWLSELQDSINTDDQNIDSLTITGTILTTYIEDGTSASVDVSSMLDSVIFSKSDTLYSIISDSLTKDTNWIKQIDSLLSIYGDTIYFNDSSYTLVRDSLLNDSLFLDSLVSLIGDSINTDDQNIDSLTLTGTVLTTYIEDGTSASIDVSNMLDSVIFSKSDTLYSIISDSLTKDSLWIKQIDSLLSIYGDTIYFNDSSYTLIRDSLLNDSLFLDSLISLIGDSINTDDQNIDSLTLTGTILTTYIEDGASATIDLQPIIDSAIANSIGTDDQNLLTPTLTGTVLNTFIENGASTSINLNTMLDSVILSKADTLYAIISDSLTKDTNWIKQIDSLLSIYGDTIYFNDSSYTLIRDSLLKDSLFMDSLISLIGDSIDTDIDSVVLIGDTLHIYEDGVDATADISGILDSIRTVDSLFTPDYVIFADSNGRLSEDIVKHFKTVINNQGDRALLLNTDSIVNTGNSNWTQLQTYHNGGTYEGIISLEDGYIGVNTSGTTDPVIHFEHRGGTFSATQPVDTSVESYRSLGTIIFLGKDSTATRGTQATLQGTSKYYDNQRLLTGFLFTGRTRTTPANPKLTLGYNFPHFHNNSELLFELNNDGNGSIQAHFYKDSRNDTTPINNFLYTDANGVFQSKSVDTLIQLMRDSLDDADWNINANGTGLEAAPAGNNVASGQYSIAAGYLDSATAQYATVSGGGYNKATASGATVGGGADNYSTAIWSTVAGGQDNISNGDYAFIGGGFNDTASGINATVAGGLENHASGQQAFIGGGTQNKATNVANVIAGGQINETSGSGSVIVGGFTNISSGQTAFIGAGISNTASGANSVVVGGTSNLASAGWAYVGGGYLDTATGSNAVVVGGRGNKVTGSYSNILGGYENINTGSYSAIGGGQRDSIMGSSYAGILSGSQNRITSSSYATIPGGYRNKVTSSSYANVSGYDNFVTGSSYADVHGYRHYMNGSFNSNAIFGYQDTAIRTVEGSFIAGRQNAIIATSPAVTGRNTIFGYDNKIYVPAVSSNESYSHSIIGGYSNTIETSPAGGFDRPISILGSLRARVLPHAAGNSRAAIVGGDGDTIQGSAGTIMAGGAGNKAHNGGGWHALVGGANNQVQQQWFSGIYSGWRNRVSNSHSAVIVAGWDNTITSGNNKSIILAGDTNIINNGADNTAIISGRGNTANNFGQTVLGHFSTNTVPAGSSASAIDPDNILFKIGNGTDASTLSDAMVVKANGNVGIGVFNPSEALEVSGNILASGTITPSDERYKTNINTLDNALANLLKLRGVSYEMKNEYKNKGFGDGLQIGVIAQEVEKIYPELIQTNKQTGYKGVDYSKFTPILIEAVKEQQDIINTNKEEIKSLKTENEELKERLNKLEETLNKILEK